MLFLYPSYLSLVLNRVEVVGVSPSVKVHHRFSVGAFSCDQKEK